jgi:alpha-beta hydrolase superfamily lysophospholipase
MGNPDVGALRASFREAHELVQTSDGKTLFLRRWNATKNADASILIFHGITAHSSPYGPMIAEQLASGGYTVFGMDLRGHGLSDGTRGDYPNRARFVKDIQETVALVKERSRGKLIVLGHSLGALSAIVAVNNDKTRTIDGLILLSVARKIRTSVYTKPKAGEMAKLLLAVSILRGRPLIRYSRKGMMIGVDDPLFNFNYSARFYSVLYGVGALSVSRMFRAGVIDSPNLKFNERLRIPLLIGVGEHDELFPQEYAREFSEEIESDVEKQFFVVAGASHAVFPKDSWSPVIVWLRQQFPNAVSTQV